VALLWFQFLASALVVVVAGIGLVRFSDVIAEKGPLGRMWVGAVLLAGATSLPEMATSISAGWMGFPDIAIGNVYGSNTFNIFTLAIIDMLEGRGSILRKVSPGHILSAVFGMLLAAIGALSIVARVPYSVLGVGVDSLLIFAVYLFGTRMLGRYDDRDPAEQMQAAIDPPPEWVRQRRARAQADPMPLRTAYIGFAVTAAAIVVAGVSLSRTGDALAEVTGLGSTFVGSTLIAAATSLPEVVATVTAVLSGAYDLAVGNILGSNTFNMVIIVLSDVAYRGGPILSAVDQAHAVVALVGLILSAIAVVGLFYRSRRSYAGLGPDSVAILITYVLYLGLLYGLR